MLLFRNEIQGLKEQVEEKVRDSDEKAKTINQVNSRFFSLDTKNFPLFTETVTFSRYTCRSSWLKSSLKERIIICEHICVNLQLRKIGRKYKDQAEAFNKQLEELKTKTETEQATPPVQEGVTVTQAEVDQQVGAIKEQLTQLEKERDDLKVKLEAQSGEFGGAKMQLSQIQQVGVWHTVAPVTIREKIGTRLYV